ncbi:adenylyltransferase/cytidyltransferase family protein [Psychrobacter sp. HD31]|uniref:adenylyltransferase/cytidyltransferase family protein n=1 Tax=Psychrobacter sp. HD31 TaxID=3112003 RepID=UPI003DA6009F
MTKVLTYGTFDLLHYGHIHLLERAKALGNHLTVAVSTVKFNLRKGKICTDSYEEIVPIINSIRHGDKIILEECWQQKITDIENHYIDIFIIGNDWKMRFDYVLKYCQALYFPRMVGMSTTEIKEKLSNNYMSIDSKEHDDE